MKLGLPPEREARQERSGLGQHAAGSYPTPFERPRGGIPRERLWLRGAAFGADLLLFGGIPLLVATFVVFGLLVAVPDVSPRVGIGFRVAQGAFVLGFLLRDATGASPGKRLFGLKTALQRGRRPLLASLVRNLPLVVPGWNLVEAVLVLRGDQRRPGDRLAGTLVSET